MQLKDKKLFLLDMDGTIYLDDRLFSGVIELLCEIKARGGRYIFMTNNSSKSVTAYIEKLEKLGIETTSEDFVTSVDASVDFLRKTHGCKESKKRRIYVMGTDSFVSQLEEEGFDIVTSLDEGIETVLCGFDRELTYKKLEDVCRLLSQTDREIEYIATNPDWVCPTEFGYVPDCGSVCKMIETATGRSPYFIGKPEPKMALLAMEKTGFKPQETLVIGDRLYTDIACGCNAGVDTCFVLSGEGTLDDLERSEIKPTYILKDIEELLRRITDET